MKKIGSGWRRPSVAAFQRNSWPVGVWRHACTRLADVDTTPSHLRHVSHEVIALHGDVAESPAPRQELEKAPTWMAGEVLVPVAHAQQFEVVLLVKRDGVVRAFTRMHAAGRDVESEARVGVDTPLEIGDADHDVVDARKHSYSSRARDPSSKRSRGSHRAAHWERVLPCRGSPSF